MPSVEYLHVSLPAETPSELSALYIDAPNETVEEGIRAPHPLTDPPPALGRSPGSTRDGFVAYIRGWVVGRSSPAISVAVVYEGRVIREVPVRGSRPDLAAANPDGGDVVFHALVGVLGLTTEFELELVALLEDGTRVPIGSVRARHQPVGPQLEPRLQPITVTRLGRSGTTMLMRMLADHPEVVVYRRHPYGSAPAKYWMQLLKVLSEPGNQFGSTDRHHFHADLRWIGHNPFYDDPVDGEGELGEYLSGGYVERLASFCQKSIEDWYGAVARRQGQDRATRFAEKHIWPNYTPLLLGELYPQSREVFLVRDFRDVAFSVLAFDSKRGYAGFSRPAGKSDEDYVRDELGGAANDLSRSWQNRRDGAYLVRYEDLARSPIETLTPLLRYLEIDASPALVSELAARSEEQSAALRLHRTSPTLEASIGRWRRERDDAFRALCQEVFEEPLEAFGYSEDAG